MPVTNRIRSERTNTFALLTAGLSVAVIALLALLGWVVGEPSLIIWKAGTLPMAPSTAALSIMFGASLCLVARMPQGRVALLLIPLFGWIGITITSLLFALRLLGKYGAAELLGLHITGTYDNLPIGYIKPITAFCFMLAYGSLLASLPHGSRDSWQGWVLWGFGGLVSLVSFAFLLAYAFGTPSSFGNMLIPSALNSSLCLLIIGLAQLVLAARCTGLAAASSETDGVRLLPYALFFLIFATGTLAVAYYSYLSNELRFRQEVESQLLTVGELKSEELVRWRMERLEDGALSQNAAMTASVRRLLETPHALSAQREMLVLLGKYQRSIGYDRAFFLDTKGITRISVSDREEPVSAVLAEGAAVSLRMRQVILQDFYRDEHDQRVYLALMVPVFEQRNGNRPLGVLVLRIDPTIYLYPLIKRWPTPSASAETLLVRRDGNDALFLNDLRFRTNAALTLRFPLLGNAELPAAKAVLGQSGIVEGLDYRGVPVIAALHDIPGSPWHIVTRIDKAEVYAPLRERMWLTVLLVSAFLCGAGTVAFFLWRQQRLVFYQRQHELTMALKESYERFEFALQKIHTGGWELNLNDNSAKCTLEHNRIFGYDSLLSNWTYEMFLEHVLPEDRPEVDRLFREAVSTDSDWDFECRIIRNDNHQIRWIWAVGGHVRAVEGGEERMTGIVQDITERKQAEEAVRESEARLDFALQNSFIGAWEMDLDDHSTRRTPIHDRIYGYETMLPCWTYEKFLEHVLPEDRPRVDRIFQEAAAGKSDWNFEFRIRRADGNVRWIYAAGGHLRHSAIKPERVSGIVQDITDRKQAEEKLRLAANVFTHAREGIMITTADGTIIDVNEAFSDITGYSRDEVLGQNPRLLSSGLQDREFYDGMWRDLVEQGYWRGELWNRRKNGDVFAVMPTFSAVRDEQGNTQHYVALYSDITLLKEHELKLERSAHYDALTSLPNRVLLTDRLHQGMVQARRREQQLAVAFLDLDGFKAINDNHGHESGDQLLITLATRMKHTLRESDTLARLGGDEFVVVLPDIGDIETSVSMLTRLLTVAAEPVHSGNVTLQVSASLGVTFYPQAEDIDADQLIRQADQAMYQAKQAGKNRYHIFDAEQDRSIRGRYENQARIRRALAAGELVLYYQPKVNMRAGRIIGAEALIRWQHPEKGLLLPDLFLLEIEDHSLAIAIDEWVIDTALAQMEIWQATGLNIPVSVNISSHRLQQTDFVERLRAMLAAHPNVSPAELELEVMETFAIKDLPKISWMIEACRKMGVSFSLDDFGTGYSSLTYLKHLPVGKLKIDQHFVRNMIDDPGDLSIVEGVIGLASAFRLLVIAEGAETVEHCTILLQLGCDLAQGDGIARPMPASQLPSWEATWRPNPAWINLSSASRVDFPLLFANVEHRAWIIAMEKYLKGERETPPPLDIHQCRFGQWLDTEEGLARFGVQPSFQAADLLHRKVHALATELCELRAQGHESEVLAGLGELHGLRDALLEQLSLTQQTQQSAEKGGWNSD